MKKGSTKRKDKCSIQKNPKLNKSEMSAFISVLLVIKESNAVIFHMLGCSRRGRIRPKCNKIFKGSSFYCGNIDKTDHPAFSTLLVCATDRLSLLKSQLAVNIWESLLF